MRYPYLLAMCLCLTYGGLKAQCDILLGTDTTAVNGESLLICNGTPAALFVSGATSFSWTPIDGIDDPLSASPMISPPAAQWYFVEGQDTSGTAVCTDSVFLEPIDPEFAVNVSRMDTICPDDIVAATFQSNFPITAVEWSPTDGVLDRENLDGSDLQPLETTEYIVTVMIGNCEVSDTFTVDVVNFRVSFLPNDTVYLCSDDLNDFQDNVTFSFFPSDVVIEWGPLDEFFEISGNLITVSNVLSTTYSVTVTGPEGCVLERDLYVRVDSLPDLALTIIPEKDPYCPGDQVIIFAEEADTALYPDLMFQWVPSSGIQDSANTGNVYITVGEDTITYTRMAENNACVDDSEITLNVIPPELPLSVTDTTLCPGDKFDVEVLDRDVTDLMWMPEEGLSCTECFKPTVTVQPTSMTYMVMAMKEGCPVGNELNVTVGQPLLISIVPQLASVCAGEQVQLMIDDSEVFNLSLSISSGEGNLSCTNCNNPIVTPMSNSVTITAQAEEDSVQFCGAFGGAVVNILPDEMAECEFNPDPADSVDVFPGDEITISINTPSAQTAMFEWTFNDIPVDASGPSITVVVNSGNDFATVKWTNTFGCEQTRTCDISDLDEPAPPQIPNAFTPNNDMENDRFIVNLNGNDIIEILVFNRWGQLVYEANDNIGWDGRFNNDEAPPDVYVFQIRYAQPNGREASEKGDVTLIR